MTARFRILFVFEALEIGSRRILHCNVTAHPTAEWTLQQLREARPSDHPYQFLIHDRDTIFSSELDAKVKSTLGLRVLRTPPLRVIQDKSMLCSHQQAGLTLDFNDFFGRTAMPAIEEAISKRLTSQSLVLK